jgi:transposase
MTAAALPATDEQRAVLERMASSTSLPHRQVVQARGLLLACAGVANEEIARRCAVDSDTVRRWRSRFAEQGPAGVGKIAKGRGRKPSLPKGTVEEVLRLTHKERPADGSTQWSTRTLAARLGIGKDAVAKIWADHNLKPWKVELQGQQRPAVRGETRRCRWPVPQSADARGGVLLRRKDPVPGVGPHPAVAADETWTGRDDDT